jgi:hypothetical protein
MLYNVRQTNCEQMARRPNMLAEFYALVGGTRHDCIIKKQAAFELLSRFGHLKLLFLSGATEFEREAAWVY